MKKIITIFFAVAFGICAFAYSPATIDNNGKLAYPNASTFAEQNNLVSNDVICVRVDMFRGGFAKHSNNLANTGNFKAYYWWEAELKVLNKDGNLIYHVSTRWADREYHGNEGVQDDNCRIFYYTSGSNSNTGICAKPKKELIRSASDMGSSIYEAERISTGVLGEAAGYFSRNKQVTTIEFLPNLDGTTSSGMSIREIFTNPENTIIVSRKNKIEIEKDYDGSRIWRAPIIIYYRK